MAYPPFPSQDLAKLVLGYLAEEQLMTAYDEFLQASPYLDAFRNEYDRIFMTSLKNILAEYRAVKIYVETCKPFVLRRKLFQCTNLVEVVKVLVSYIDINRLHTQESSLDKSSYKSSVISRSNVCEVCFSTGACICKKSAKACTLSSQNDTSIDTSIETTSLADLPGNSVTKKRLSKDLIDVVQPSYSVTECGNVTQNPLISRDEVETIEVPMNSNLKQDYSNEKIDESKQKIEEFNTILNLVCSNNDSYQTKNFVPETTANTNKTIGSAGTFQEFAKGVTGLSDTEKSIVPDSSTSENFNSQLTAPRENIVNLTPITNIKPKHQILLTVGTPQTMQKQLLSNITNQQQLSNLKPDDQKITILSDIKVDNTFKNNAKMPPVLKSASSTPLLQFQTILINGTPAYKPQNPNSNMNYTKDEIMAMPTFFVVSATGASQNPAPVTLHNTIAESTTVTTTSNSSKTKLLGPLVIDVPSNDPLPDSSKLPELSSDPKNKPDMSLVTTVDLTNTHGSLPKNTNLTVNKSSTPHILPPTRKSCSTPRRSSHIRVLDFTTPRRILHETINKQEDKKSEVNVVPDIPVHTNIISATVNTVTPKIETSIKKKSIKEKNLIAYKKRNWDAELRVLAVRNDDKFVPAPILKPKTKKSKKNLSETSRDKKDVVDSSKDTMTPKPKKNKKRKSEIIEQPIDVEKNSPDVIIVNENEPISNTVTNCKTESSREFIEDEKIDTKVAEERVDTPENDRIALQNVIGARLNISDFLETPYKQVLYDIQMETPKFLGSDIPDEPMSDIKIMSIPTPLFLNTPKPLLTPSSYSSRPTDYSSGGSYYKPDDQDYVPTSEVMKCAFSIESSPPTKNETVDIEEKVVTSNRPRRKCTKYVSYYKSPVSSKVREDGKEGVGSECSEVNYHNSREKRTRKLSESKKTKSKSKSESKKKINISTIKSPLKKPSPKKFMRIKPRRTTPVKEIFNKNKRKSDMSPKLVIKSRNRTSSQNKSISIAPIVIAAPTKSRRKSSTPRKIQCTKSFNSDFDVNTCDNTKPNLDEKSSTIVSNDSDVEQPPLRWSDDGSQDSKVNQVRPSSSTVDEEDITKIKEYIETSAVPCIEKNAESLHIDLIKRGFDIETAKSIERDLLDTTPVKDKTNMKSVLEDTIIKVVSQNVSNKIESDSSTNNLEIVQDEAEEDEVEFSVHDCEEGSNNFMTCIFDEATFLPKELTKLKEKYSMELCIDDGVSVRLRATGFTSLFHEISEDPEYNYKETVAAVNSICDIEQLYTPMKQRGLICHDIFNSTLTSLDTPLKSDDVKETYETTITEIVLEAENTEVKDTKKRKRAQTVTTDELTNKKVKPDTQYLLNSANIQNIDIESVLSKLHGP